MMSAFIASISSILRAQRLGQWVDLWSAICLFVGALYAGIFVGFASDMPKAPIPWLALITALLCFIASIIIKRFGSSKSMQHCEKSPPHCRMHALCVHSNYNIDYTSLYT